MIAAIHRDWGEAQGNYDEFRFFTGLRPSEQIALVLTDLDRRERHHQYQQGARLRGRSMQDQDRGRSARATLPEGATGSEETASPARAPRGCTANSITIMSSCTTPASPMRDLQVAAIRWRKTLRSLKVRYRRPLHRPSFLGELEPDARQESALGRQAARPQPHHDAADLRRVDRWCGGSRRSDDRAIDGSDADPYAARPTPQTASQRRPTLYE